MSAAHAVMFRVAVLFTQYNVDTASRDPDERPNAAVADIRQPHKRTMKAAERLHEMTMRMVYSERSTRNG
jgi:hypothetical protein